VIKRDLLNGPQLKPVMILNLVLDKVLHTKGETQENKKGPKTEPWGTPPHTEETSTMNVWSKIPEDLKSPDVEGM